MQVSLSPQHQSILTSQVLVGTCDQFITLKEAGFSPYLELRMTIPQNNTNKFWRVEVAKDGVQRRWGRIGTLGTQKKFPSIGEMLDAWDSKQKRGYTSELPVGMIPHKVESIGSVGDDVVLYGSGRTVIWKGDKNAMLKVLAVCAVDQILFY